MEVSHLGVGTALFLKLYRELKSEGSQIVQVGEPIFKTSSSQSRDRDRPTPSLDRIVQQIEGSWKVVSSALSNAIGSRSDTGNSSFANEGAAMRCPVRVILLYDEELGMM